jgi:hypothetical protein
MQYVDNHQKYRPYYSQQRKLSNLYKLLPDIWEAQPIKVPNSFSFKFFLQQNIIWTYLIEHERKLLSQVLSGLVLQGYLGFIRTPVPYSKA